MPKTMAREKSIFRREDRKDAVSKLISLLFNY
jgi:hypothetical protein